ncbi:MAG: hypothetical protein KKA31_00220 [Candidatus Margulisbacteria bacterium]|nr:hypothetical protein [Candidatus Margulisiibacteriota bacterium]
MKKSLISLLLIVFLFSTTYAIPSQISFQGLLTDSSDKLIDDTVSIVFSIYAGITGGTALWTETQTVTVEGGIYTVQLGAVTPIGNIFDGTTRYLGIKVGSDAEMTPRLPMISVPYAFRAGTAESATAATDADTVDGFHASSTPEASKILPLSASTHFSLTSPNSIAGYFNSTSDGLARGVYGTASSSDEALSKYGGYFESYNVGVRGVTNGKDFGDNAVAGLASSTDTNAEHHGGYFEAHGGKAIGAFGWATDNTGINAGVKGDTNSPNGYGVWGKNQNFGPAVYVQWILQLEPTFMPPGDGQAGMMFFNSGDNKLYVHNGTTWEVVTSYVP